MDARGWSVGAAAFLVVGLVIWLPKGAVGQSLAGQAAAAGISSDLSARSSASGVNSLSRARSSLKTTDPHKAWIDAVSGAPVNSPKANQEPQPAPAQAARTVSDTASLSLLAGAKSLAPMKGWVVSAEGRVEEVETIKGALAYRIIPGARSGFSSSDRLIFDAPLGEKFLAKPGDKVRAFGVFLSETKTKKGMRVLFFDQAQLVAGPALAEAQLKSDSENPAVGVFEDPLEGWKLSGTASGLHSGTAVFVSPDEKPKFLSPGDTFGSGFRLVSVRPGEAVLEKGDKELTVIAW